MLLSTLIPFQTLKMYIFFNFIISCEIIILTVAFQYNFAILYGFFTQHRLPLIANEISETMLITSS